MWVRSLLALRRRGEQERVAHGDELRDGAGERRELWDSGECVMNSRHVVAAPAAAGRLRLHLRVHEGLVRVPASWLVW
mgnify:CR=1 FL=1